MTFPTMQEVAEALETARQGQGLSIAELSRRTGISPRQVAGKLAAGKPITTADLHSFTEALGTTPGKIYAQLG